MQVVWHGRYFEYFEVARTKLLRAHGLDSHQIAGFGLRTYVVDARIRYMAALRYGDTVRCTVWFSDVRPHIRMAYLLDNLTMQARSARAHMVIAATNADGELFAETPLQIIERLPGRWTV